jgi:hypothetical protein
MMISQKFWVWGLWCFKGVNPFCVFLLFFEKILFTWVVLILTSLLTSNFKSDACLQIFFRREKDVLRAFLFIVDDFNKGPCYSIFFKARKGRRPILRRRGEGWRAS